MELTKYPFEQTLNEAWVREQIAHIDRNLAEVEALMAARPPEPCGPSEQPGQLVQRDQWLVPVLLALGGMAAGAAGMALLNLPACLAAAVAVIAAILVPRLLA